MDPMKKRGATSDEGTNHWVPKSWLGKTFLRRMRPESSQCTLVYLIGRDLYLGEIFKEISIENTGFSPEK